MAPEPIQRAPKAAPKAPAAAPVAPKAPAGPAPRLPGDALALQGAVKAARETWTLQEPIESEGSSFAPTLANRRHVGKKKDEDASTEARAMLKRQKGGVDPTYDEVRALRDQVGRDRKAQLEVAANFGMELPLSKKLPGDQPSAYARVAKALGEDPMGRLALQKLLLNGELPGKAAHGGASMLSLLDDLLASPLVAGVSASELVAGLVKEVAEPGAIQQGYVRTCGATTCQIDLALRWPAEYVRLVKGLALPKGEVVTAGGVRLLREPFAKYTNDRSESSRLFQDALMEHANGPTENYNPSTDKNEEDKPVVAFQGSGLGVEDMTRALKALWGEASTHEAVDESVWGAKACLVATKAALDQRLNVPSAFSWAEDGVTGIKRAASGHAVLVVGHGPEGIRIANPHGAEQLMSEAAFLERIRHVQVPKALLPQGQPPAGLGAPEGPRPKDF